LAGGLRDRIDALGRDRARLESLSGAVLSDAPDEQLQRLVEKAAAAANAPMSLVTLLLDHVQFFRAHVGLPRDLAAARATDRDASFCQLVVRDEQALEVVCAGRDERVPQELVRRYGIQSYYGVPVHANGSAVGALCVIDTQPREFAASQREQLRALSHQVSQRLGELASGRTTSLERHRRLLAGCASPAFAEIRNQLVPLMAHNASLQLAVTELAPLARLIGEGGAVSPDALAVLSSTATAVARLQRLPFEQERVIAEIVGSVVALEHVAVPTDGHPLLTEVFETSDRLAHHYTKLVGGVRWPQVDRDSRVEARRSEACMALSSLASSIALASSKSPERRQLAPTYERIDGHHRVSFAIPAEDPGEAAVSAAVHGLGDLLVDRDDLALVIEPEVVTLSLRGK